MEEANKKKQKRKITFIVFIILIAILLGYYSVMSMIAPVKKLDQINSEYGIKPSEKNPSEQQILTDSTYLKLLKEKAFLQSRILMAETDSIYLTLNLVDSTANIEISGVVVYRSKISSFKTSRILSSGNRSTILAMLSTPFTISHSYSTIRKEPLMIKMAPKDTSEYKPDIMPDTSITEPVNYILELKGGIRLYVYQEEKDNAGDRINQFRFDLTDRLRNTWMAIKKVAFFKVPEYYPYIKIKLSRSNAKIIFRAIPKSGQIGLLLN